MKARDRKRAGGKRGKARSSPIPPPPRLLEAYRGEGQEHVFRFWEELPAEERQILISQLETIDLRLVRDLGAGKGVVGSAHREGPCSPAPVVRLGEEPSLATRSEARNEGLRLLAEGKIGVFLVAGGQGSRLGFEGPKGCLPAGPISGKTLFQLHAEKIRALSERCGGPIRWFIMTSAANDAATRRFFEEQGFFGLPRDVVRFIAQPMLPALDGEGKLILESRSRIFSSPNGHGGAYGALQGSGCLEEAERLGIEHLFYFQVDNLLIRIADPTFLGLHALAEADMSLKVLRKAGPEEKIGVLTLEEGRHRVIEYSDLPVSEATRRDARGQLVHWAGSIAIHAFRVPFLRRVADGAIPLPYHVARKSIPSVDEAGNLVQVDGRKFETFVFDALPAAERVVSLEVRREEEFAPIKNSAGVDSLESAREMLLAEHARWMREAGAGIEGRVEISPLAALDAEDVLERLPRELRRAYAGDIIVEPGPAGTLRIERPGRPA